jgi:hypothetical protein
LWRDVLYNLSTENNGPKIDLRKELIQQFGTRITILTDYQLPITTTSERLLIAIEAKNSDAIAKALKKMFQNDPDMRRREFEGYEMWEAVHEKKSEVPDIDLQLPGESAGESRKPSARGQQSLLPNEVLTVGHGHLLIASHYEFLVKILAKGKKPEMLTKSVEYQVVSKSMEKFGVASRAAESFAKTDEQVRPTYELIRQGKMPESETMLGRLLNTIFGAGKKGVLRKQEIDGSKMPEFDVVRRYLGPAGLQIASEADGWLIKGFVLKKGQ